LKQDSELVHGLFPDSWWHCPLFSGIAQGQIQKLGRRLITREMAPVFDDLAQAHIQALNGVGGIDDFAYILHIKGLLYTIEYNMRRAEDFISRLDVLEYGPKAAAHYGDIRADLE